MCTLKQFSFKNHSGAASVFCPFGEMVSVPAQSRCTYKEALYCLLLLLRAAITKKLTSLWDNVVPSGAFVDFLLRPTTGRGKSFAAWFAQQLRGRTAV